MKEITVSYAEQLKHYFCTCLNIRNFLMPWKKEFTCSPKLHFMHCFRTLFLQTAHFLCFSSTVRSDACPESLLRTSSGTRTSVFLLSDGQPDFLGSDTDEVFMYTRTILRPNFSSGIFSFAMQYCT